MLIDKLLIIGFIICHIILEMLLKKNKKTSYLSKNNVNEKKNKFYNLLEDIE